MTKKLIPFFLWPYSWGMAGKTRQIAEAEYSLVGYDLKIALLDISRDDLTDDEYKRKYYDIQLEYNKITKGEYYLKNIELITDDFQKQLALLEFNFKNSKIGELEYNKQLASLKKEPWVNVVNMDFTKGSSLEGSFELDWNTYFIEKLKKEGYTATTDEAIINQWFMELCRNVALEEFDGTGDFTNDSAANLEAFKKWNNVESLPAGKKGYR